MSFQGCCEVHGELFLVFLESLGWVLVPDLGLQGPPSSRLGITKRIARNEIQLDKQP